MRKHARPARNIVILCFGATCNKKIVCWECDLLDRLKLLGELGVRPEEVLNTAMVLSWLLPKEYMVEICVIEVYRCSCPIHNLKA